MRLFHLLAFAVALSLTGCHSAFMEATVSNRTPSPLSLVEVDYPSASFGTQTLSPGADFYYRFKVLGSGPTTLTWTDASHRDHKASGPALDETDEGTLTIVISAAPAPSWSLHLTNRTVGR